MGQFQSNNLPESFLKCMSKKVRKQNGITQLTQEEAKRKNDLALEKELQNQIAQDLNRRGIIASHSKFGVKPTIAAGLPDFMFCLYCQFTKRGWPIAMECKLPGEKLSEDQMRVMEQMCNNGWCYSIVHTFEEYSALVKTYTS
jgi:hypothetical protein